MAKKDLRSFKKAKGSGLDKEDIREAAKKARVNIGDIGDNDVQNMEETISKYENKSEGELMSDLERMIAQGRKDGTFTDEMLNNFVRNVSPMMDNAQRKKLENIKKMIKINKI